MTFILSYLIVDKYINIKIYSLISYIIILSPLTRSVFNILLILILRNNINSYNLLIKITL